MTVNNPTPCCGRITTDPLKPVLCQAGGGFTYTFDVTNTSGQAAQFLLLSPTAGSTFTASPNVVSGPIGNTQTTTVNLALANAVGGQNVCVDVQLTANACCFLQTCVTLPRCDCLQVRPSGIAQCAGHGTYSYTFSLDNFTGLGVNEVFVLPESPSTLTLTPQLFPFSTGPQTLTIFGAAAGSNVCLRLEPKTQGSNKCCSTEQCFTLPACP